MSASLPERPSLAYLKKQAKELLKVHDAGGASCCRILRHLHRFADATDQAVLAEKFTLKDVQFALVMDYGFKSWAALKAHVQAAGGPELAGDVRRDGQKVWIDGARSFENSDSTLSHLRAVTSVLAHHGETVNWDWLMGASGEAFCYYYHPDGTHLTQHVHSWDVANAALGAFGYHGRWQAPDFGNDVATILLPFAAELAEGRPVIAPGIVPQPNGINSRCDHWFVVSGVDLAAGTVTVLGAGRTPVETRLPEGDVGPTGPHPCWYGILRTFAPGSNGHYGPDRSLMLVNRTEPAKPPAALVMDAVHRAVDLAREPSTRAITGWGRGTYLAGLAAMQYLHDDLLAAQGDGLEAYRHLNPAKDAPFGGLGEEARLLHLLSRRRAAAARFLR